MSTYGVLANLPTSLTLLLSAAIVLGLAFQGTRLWIWTAVLTVWL